MTEHLETEAERGAIGRTSASGSYRSPDAQAAMPFTSSTGRHDSTPDQRGDQSRDVAWMNWAPIPVYAPTDSQNMHDGTGYYHRPN